VASKKQLRYLGTYSVSMFGTGLMYPVHALYISQYHHQPISIVGFYYAVAALCSVLIAMPAGRYSDLHSPIRLVLPSAALQFLGLAFVPVLAGSWLVLCCAIPFGLGTGIFFAVQTPTIATLFGTETLRELFARQYQVMNIALGLGAVAGTLLASTRSGSAYVAIYLANALTYLLHAVNIRNLSRTAMSAPAPQPGGGRPDSAGRLGVFRDRRFLPLIVVQFIVIAFGMAQLEAGFPVALRVGPHLPLTEIGVCIALNSVVCVVVQPTSLRLVKAWGASRAVTAAVAAWILAIAFGLTAYLASAPSAVIFLIAIAFTGLFAWGETLLAPALQPLAVTLAPEGMMGRYTAALSLVTSLGITIGPAIALTMLGQLGSASYWILLAAAYAVAAAAIPALARSEHRTPQETTA
jgi:MFS family permease